MQCAAIPRRFSARLKTIRPVLWALVVGMGLASAIDLGTVSGEDQPQVMKSHCFVVKDAVGRERAILGFQGGAGSQAQRANPTLRLLAANGQVRFEIGYSDADDSSFLHMLRADGTHGLTLLSGKDGNSVTFEHQGKRQPAIALETWHEPSGQGEGGLIELFNPQGIPQVGMAVWPDDGPGMRLYDPEGQPFEPGSPPAVIPPARPQPKFPAPATDAKRTSGESRANDTEYPVLEAEAFQLVDDRHEVRAVYGQADDEGGHSAFLLFFDVNGEARAGMFFREGEDMAKLAFNNERGQETLGISVSPDGCGIFLTTANQNQSIGATVVNSKDQEGVSTSVCLSGSDGRGRVIFGEHRGRGTLGAWDRTGDKLLLIVE